ncbi:MAG TPA: rRNA adenine N(6)-methyltransferase family protein [Acidimicrobiales bacterium]|nr:rRNA adenine N(6)-methyltransferase family protein [Acidimicrobiales bacterium]
MPAEGRTARDERRRRLGQNFLRPQAAERFVFQAGVRPGEVVIDIGAGSGALCRALVARGAEVLAVEVDPVWAAQLRALARTEGLRHISVLETNFLTWPLPERPFRVLACPPFGATTAILHRLLDNPEIPLVRADLVVQWEVARKRASGPPGSLLSVTWAPWWEFRLGPRLRANQFRPVPRVDGGTLVITRRSPPLLPASMAPAYNDFVRRHWPFPSQPTVTPGPSW